MKSIYTLAVIAALGLVSARADDVIGSPKYQEANRRPLTGGTEVTQKFEFARSKNIAVNQSLRGGTEVRQTFEFARGKGLLRDSQKQFEIAPVK